MAMDWLRWAWARCLPWRSGSVGRGRNEQAAMLKLRHDLVTPWMPGRGNSRKIEN
jgi:hypothetical protein